MSGVPSAEPASTTTISSTSTSASSHAASMTAPMVAASFRAGSTTLTLIPAAALRSASASTLYSAARAVRRANQPRVASLLDSELPIHRAFVAWHAADELVGAGFQLDLGLGGFATLRLDDGG